MVDGSSEGRLSHGDEFNVIPGAGDGGLAAAGPGTRTWAAYDERIASCRSTEKIQTASGWRRRARLQPEIGGSMMAIFQDGTCSHTSPIRNGIAGWSRSLRRRRGRVHGGEATPASRLPTRTAASSGRFRREEIGRKAAENAVSMLAAEARARPRCR